ncbi:MAG: hypothetical protein AB8G16_08345, partial [Gammaproteobacteria bacterium]
MNYKKLVGLSLSALMASSVYADRISVELIFDNYPEDINFSLQRDGSGLPFDPALSSAEGSAAGDSWGNFPNALAGQSHSYVWDLPYGDYEFVITDAYGDGMCCNEGEGNYIIRQNEELLYAGSGSFGSGENFTFSIGGPQVIHSYPFNGTLGDSVGGVAMEANGGTIENGRYQFDGNQGLTLRDALLDVNDYAIEVGMRIDTAQNFFVKLLDFLDLTSDNGLYIAGDNFIFYNETIDSARSIQPGEDFVFVLSQEASGETRGYV